MNPRDLLAEAWRALMAYRLRAALSAAGIIVGIATIVTAMAIGAGARDAAVAEIAALGIDNVIARAVRAGASDPTTRVRAPALTREDADAIRQRVREIASVATIRVARAEVAAGSRLAVAPIVGVTDTWADVTGLTMARGRWIADRDDRDRRRIAVLGSTLARTLFAGADPIGRDVHVNGTAYRVVGIVAAPDERRRDRPAIQGHDAAASVLMPVSAMDVSLGEGDSLDKVDEIAVRTGGPDAVARVSAAIDQVLRARTPVKPVYEIVVPRELLAARLRAQRTFTMVLFAISALALAIAGVGIMNIMLASVVERTAEIGVRRAFGASRAQVVMQFAAESTLLCLVGGAIGVPLGAVLSAAVAWLAAWPVSISAGSVAIAMALAGGVGVASGIHPARLAARLDPAVALRAE